MSPTQRTLAVLKAQNMPCQVVEKWNPWAKIRQDLFGIIDIVALDTQNGRIRGIQCTSGSNHAARVNKAKNTPSLAFWTGCGGGFEVWSWAKQGKRGERKVWTLRVEVL